jgi:hypothetical protein
MAEWITNRTPEIKSQYIIMAENEKGQRIKLIAVWNGTHFVTDLLPVNSRVIAWKELD